MSLTPTREKRKKKPSDNSKKREEEVKEEVDKGEEEERQRKVVQCVKEKAISWTKAPLSAPALANERERDIGKRD